jgi:hypothetical protein
LPSCENTFSQLGKLRLLAHRAGVQQHDVGLCRVGRQFKAIGLAQHVGHARRVVFIHLAAEGRDMESAAHAGARASHR